MLILFFILLFTPCLADETLTITTYYPSPFGSYNELRAKKMAIGETYYGPDAVSWDFPCPIGGCTSAATSLVVEGRVGIGTKYPEAALDVLGMVKMVGFQLGTSAPNGTVLTANSLGVGTWQALSGGAQGLCGWCEDNWNRQSGPGSVCQPPNVFAPAFCTPSMSTMVCACPSGYQQVLLGRDNNNFRWYACYKL